jgi:hypothetical protein
MANPPKGEKGALGRMSGGLRSSVFKAQTLTGNPDRSDCSSELCPTIDLASVFYLRKLRPPFDPPIDHRRFAPVEYWEGWAAWMRASAWRRFGWYVWDQGPGLPGD